jgi:hypothetical protein
MFRRIISKWKEWMFARQDHPIFQDSEDLVEEEIPIGEQSGDEDGQSGAKKVLDDATTDEVVATWNLLNPP